jgi:hypothetical protein
MHCLKSEAFDKLVALRMGIHDLEDKDSFTKRVEEILIKAAHGQVHCPHDNGNTLHVLHQSDDGHFVVVCGGCHEQFVTPILEQQVRCPHCELIDIGMEMRRVWMQRNKP